MVERWLFALLLAAGMSQAGAAPLRPAPVEPAQAEQRIATLSEQLRCLVCQNQSLAESDAALAADLRNQVRTLVLAGRSDHEVVDHLVERYGDFIRYDPPFKPSTWLLWLVPAALPLVGLGMAMRYVRSRPAGGVE